ncbi:MAG: hypothetical protein HY700_09725 [Gemmatimonadetes bacterium]|nr:hypothetical protein [Gemmatimonadota bacterium]
MRWLRFASLLLAVSAPAGAQLPASLSDSSFGEFSAQFSEPGGFFDTDNLISNEDSYLHAITILEQLGIRGGAYLGVGPDQNFSYIAAIRPESAFIVDNRRDNLLEQLLYKAVFALSRNRIEFLCLLFGKAPPPGGDAWSTKEITDLLRGIDAAPQDSAAALARVGRRVARLGIPLRPADRITIAGFHRIFISRGPALRMTTFDRPERTDYPDYRRLLLETDRSGRRANYLATEAGFRIVKDLEDRNLVIPVVGDFAGQKALALIAQYLRAHDAVTSVFYTSNVEQYLVQDGLMGRFRRNVEQLPRGANGVIVRSYFPYGRPHPQRVSGYLSVQLVQRLDRFLAARDSAGHQGYYDLVSRDLVEPK